MSTTADDTPLCTLCREAPVRFENVGGICYWCASEMYDDDRYAACVDTFDDDDTEGEI